MVLLEGVGLRPGGVGMIVSYATYRDGETVALDVSGRRSVRTLNEPLGVSSDWMCGTIYCGF